MEHMSTRYYKRRQPTQIVGWRLRKLELVKERAIIYWLNESVSKTDGVQVRHSHLIERRPFSEQVGAGAAEKCRLRGRAEWFSA